MNARAPIGRAPTPQLVEGRPNPHLPVAPGRRQSHSGRPGIDHHGDTVLRAQLFRKESQGLLHEGQLIRGIHRARYVNQKNEVGGGTVPQAHLFALDANAREVVLRFPGTGGHFQVGGKGGVIRRSPVVVAEIIDKLLHPHGILRRPLSIPQKTAHVGVRRRIHVDGEGGEGRLGDRVEAILYNGRVTLAVFDGHHDAHPTGCRSRRRCRGNNHRHGQRLRHGAIRSGRGIRA